MTSDLAHSGGLGRSSALVDTVVGVGSKSMVFVAALESVVTKLDVFVRIVDKVSEVCSKNGLSYIFFLLS